MKKAVLWVLAVAMVLSAAVWLLFLQKTPEESEMTAAAPVRTSASSIGERLLQRHLGQRSISRASYDTFYIDLLERMIHYTLETPGTPIWTLTKNGQKVNVAPNSVYGDVMGVSSAAYPLGFYDTLDTRYAGDPFGFIDDEKIYDSLRFVMQHSRDYLSAEEVQSWLTATGYPLTVTEGEMRIAAQLTVYSLYLGLTPPDWTLDIAADAGAALSDAYPNVQTLFEHYWRRAALAPGSQDSVEIALDESNAHWSEQERFGPLTLQFSDAPQAYQDAVFGIETVEHDSAFSQKPYITDVNGAALSQIRVGQPFYVFAPGAEDWEDDIGIFELHVYSLEPLPYQDVVFLASDRVLTDIQNAQEMITARRFTGIVHFRIVMVFYKDMDK